MSSWQVALELNEDRECVRGSAEALCDAVRRGADLRIGTAFRHYAEGAGNRVIEGCVNLIAELKKGGDDAIH